MLYAWWQAVQLRAVRAVMQGVQLSAVSAVMQAVQLRALCARKQAIQLRAWWQAGQLRVLYAWRQAVQLRMHGGRRCVHLQLELRYSAMKGSIGNSGSKCHFLYSNSMEKELGKSKYWGSLD